VGHPPKLGHIAQTVNARGYAYANRFTLQPLVARQFRGRGFGIESTADVLLTKPPTRTSGASYFHEICRENEEPTSGLEPLYCSLRVMPQALQALAQGCKPRISKPIPLPSLARRCTVLHSRWCQSGVNIILIFAGHPRPPVASQIQSVAEGGPGLPPIRRFDEAPVPLGRHGVRLVVSSSTSTSSRLTCSSTVQVSSTIQVALRLLACGWRFESVPRELGLRRGLTGYS
jgi:hypothetical protein